METTATPGFSDPLALRAAWAALRSGGKVRNRDAAERLGVTEAELIASQCGEGVTRLEGDFRRLLERLDEVGPVMALTRNDDVVHEKVGRYENVSADGMVGLALGDDIDLPTASPTSSCSTRWRRRRAPILSRSCTCASTATCAISAWPRSWRPPATRG